jgi:hypothetical protein
LTSVILKVGLENVEFDVGKKEDVVPNSEML